MKEKVKRELDKRYGLVEKGVLAVCTLLKGKIRSAMVKIKNFVVKGIAYRQNNVFRNNQSQLCKELGGTANVRGEATPNADKAKEFWGTIWSVDKKHDKEASWLGDVRDRLDTIN